LDMLRLLKGLIYAVGRNVVRKGSRYKVYLLAELNDVWRLLEGKKVQVFIKVDE